MLYYEIYVNYENYEINNIKKTMRTLLAPISWLYGLGLAIRHTLYDSRLLPSHKAYIPTICVGNLAVGGTGKTPHVEYLIRLINWQLKA